MAYIDIEYLDTKLGHSKLVEYTDEERTGEVNEARVQSAIDFAEGTFNSYMSARYNVPVVPTTPFIQSLLEALAVYDMNKTRIRDKDDAILLAYDRVIKFLDSVARGLATLSGGTLLVGEVEVGTAPPKRYSSVTVMRRVLR